MNQSKPRLIRIWCASHSPAGSLLEVDVENAGYAGLSADFHVDCRKLGFERVDRGRRAKEHGRRMDLGIERDSARIDSISC